MPADLALKATVPTAERPPRPHVDYLDGVRAWPRCTSPSATPGPAAPTVADAPGTPGGGADDYGHQAVDVFLVLSGFCLMLPVVRHGTLAGGAWGFYLRRARRILPPYYAALGLCVLLLLLLPLVSHHHGARFTPAGLVVNALLLQDLFPPLANQFDAPTWTVAVEWKIYFLFPLLVWLLGRAGPGAVLLLTAALGAGLTALLHRLAPAMPLDHTCPWYVALFGLGVLRRLGNKIGPIPGKWLCGLGAATVLLLIVSVLPSPSPLGRTALERCQHGGDGGVPAGAVGPGQAPLARAVGPGPAVLASAGVPGHVRLLPVFTPFSLAGSGDLGVQPSFPPRPAGAHLGGARAPTRSPIDGTGRPVAVRAPPVPADHRAGPPADSGPVLPFFVVCERPFLNTRRRESLAQTARDAALAPAP